MRNRFLSLLAVAAIAVPAAAQAEAQQRGLQKGNIASPTRVKCCRDKRKLSSCWL